MKPHTDTITPAGIQKIDRKDYITALLIIALHIIVGIVIFSPYAYRDEAMYIINSGALAGYRSDFNNLYGIGFSLLLLPSVLIKNFLTPYNFAIILNSLWHGGILITLINLARYKRIPYPLLTGIIISSYPSIWLYGNHAMPETTITLLILLMYLALERYEAHFHLRDLKKILLFGSIASIMHPRMLIFTPICLFLLFITVIDKKVTRQTAQKLTFVILIIIAVSFFLKVYANSFQHLTDVALNDLYLSNATSIIDKLTESPLNFFLALVSSMAGQLLYLSMATLGLATLGIYNSIGTLSAKLISKKFPYQSLFFILGVIGVLLISGIQKTSNTLPDQFIFGRYLDVFTPLLALLGIKHLHDFSKNSEKNKILLIFLVVTTVLLLWLLVFLRHEDIQAVMEKRHRFWTIPGLSYCYFINNSINFPVFFSVSTATLLCGLLIWAFSGKQGFFLVFLLLFFISQSLLLSYRSYTFYVEPRRKGISELKRLAKTDLLQKTQCVYYDVTGRRGWEMYDLGVRLLGTEIHLVDDINTITSLGCNGLFFSTQAYSPNTMPPKSLLTEINYPTPLFLYQMNN